MSGTSFAILSIGTGYFYILTGSITCGVISMLTGVAAIIIGAFE